VDSAARDRIDRGDTGWAQEKVKQKKFIRTAGHDNNIHVVDVRVRRWNRHRASTSIGNRARNLRDNCNWHGGRSPTLAAIESDRAVEEECRRFL